MKFHNWFKRNHQWVDNEKKININGYDCMLKWDDEERHWRVECHKIGNVGRSKLSAKDAIEDAKATLKEK